MKTKKALAVLMLVPVLASCAVTSSGDPKTVETWQAPPSSSASNTPPSLSDRVSNLPECSDPFAGTGPCIKRGEKRIP